jgi:hypothetical protein
LVYSWLWVTSRDYWNVYILDDGCGESYVNIRGEPSVTVAKHRFSRSGISSEQLYLERERACVNGICGFIVVYLMCISYISRQMMKELKNGFN